MQTKKSMLHFCHNARTHFNSHYSDNLIFNHKDMPKRFLHIPVEILGNHPYSPVQ